jgi:hypothetical protein
MKSTFTGYYRPTDKEFAEIWKTCIFAFDASVLLDLYRSTKNTRDILLTVLDRVQDRIWLPYQAGLEYQNNRLGVISSERGIYAELGKFVSTLGENLKTKMHNHAIESADDFVKQLTTTGEEIAKALSEAQKLQPDLVQSDHIRDKLTQLFDHKVGNRFEDKRLEEIYKDGAKRYEAKIPPGFRDSEKGGTRQYGDLVVWFELLELAKSKKKPLTFITSDSKDDWWWEHNQFTIGPRPELVQEMFTVTAMKFYMYNIEGFLNQAQQYLETTVEAGAVTKAAEEFKDIQATRETKAEDNENRLSRLRNLFSRLRTEFVQRSISDSSGLKERLSSVPSSQWNTVHASDYRNAVQIFLGRDLTISDLELLEDKDTALIAWAAGINKDCWGTAESVALYLATFDPKNKL